MYCENFKYEYSLWKSKSKHDLIVIRDQFGNGTGIYYNDNNCKYKSDQGTKNKMRYKIKNYLSYSKGWNWDNFEKVDSSIIIRKKNNDYVSFYKDSNGSLVMLNNLSKKIFKIGRQYHGYCKRLDSDLKGIDEVKFNLI